MVDFPPQTPHWRGVIAGAAQFCNEHPHVRLRLPTSDWDMIGDEEAIDGVIAVIAKPDPADNATRFGRPVINVSSICFPVPFPTVTIDNVAVGRAAAQHLLGQGYPHF